MKNLLLFASVLLVSGIVMVSCSKDETLTKTETLENSLITVDLDETINKFTTDYAYFESDEVLRSFFTQYNNASTDMKESLLQKVTYLTLKKHLDVIYGGMDDLTTREDFMNYVNNYSNLIEVATINGEEEVVEKELSRHAIAPFLNVDRIIKVGNEYRKYIGEYYVASTNYGDLAGINFTKDIQKSGLDNKKVVSVLSGILDKGPDDFHQELFNDNSGCKNDRLVELDAFFQDYQTYVSVGGLQFVNHDISPMVIVTAKRKGIPCIWYKYNTNIQWDNFHVEYKIDGGAIQTWTASNTAVYADCIERDHGSQFLGAFAPVVEWKKIRSTVGSQGIGAQVMDIDEIF